MSVPPDRMVARTPPPTSNKIMGLPKWAFFTVIALGAVLAFYIYKKQSASSALANTAAGTTEGVTAADIGGTPADNSFATQTDAAALEAQIQAMQNSLFQLSQSNGGNGAGVAPPGSDGSTTSTAAGIPNITRPFAGDLIGGGVPSGTYGGSLINSPTNPIVSPSGAPGNLIGGRVASGI